MKPYIFITNPSTKKDSPTVTITTRELKEAIESAYEEGRKDGESIGYSRGYADGKASGITTITPNWPNVYYYTSNDPPVDPLKITCDAHNSVGD